MFTVDPVYARDHGPGHSVASAQNQSQGVQEDLIGCPYQDSTKKEGASTPLGRLEAHGLTGSFSCTTYLIPL